MKSFILETRKKIKEAKKIYNLYYEVASAFDKEYEKKVKVISNDLEKLKKQFDKDSKDINSELNKFDQKYGAVVNGGFDKEETKNKAKKELISICKKIEKSNFSVKDGEGNFDYQKYFESFISDDVKINLKKEDSLLYININSDDEKTNDDIIIEYYKEGNGDNEYTNFKKGIKKITIGSKTSKFTIDENARIANKIKKNYIRIPKTTDLIRDLKDIITNINNTITEISNNLEEKNKDGSFKETTDKKIEEVFKVGNVIFIDYNNVTTSNIKKQKIIEYLTNILDEIKSFIVFENIEENNITQYEEKSNYFVINEEKYIKEIYLGGVSISKLSCKIFDNYIIPDFLLEGVDNFERIVEAINKPSEEIERPEDALDDATEVDDVND